MKNIERTLILEIANRFEKGGCCGKRSVVSSQDIKALGLWPLPEVYQSSLGNIIPMAGWKSFCVYVYEKLSGLNYPLSNSDKDPADPIVIFLRNNQET